MGAKESMDVFGDVSEYLCVLGGNLKTGERNSSTVPGPSDERGK